ncbi:MAG: M56 family metallopeptidase [Clostridia bacterium]|nr:M56 family metallopeptidase [Clostridia bacterium]
MIDWIVSSSVLIAVIIALRYLLKGKISLWLQYALWGLVLVRLLIPFSVGGSSFSVMNTVEQASVVQDVEIIKNVDHLEHRADGSVEGYFPSDYMRDFPTLVAKSKTDQEYARLQKLLSFRQVFIAIWLFGAAALLFVFVISNGRLASRLRQTRKPLNINCSALPVYVTQAVETPCLFGVFAPAIYLTPEAAADATMLRHSVEHELTHFRHGDNFWSLLRCVCLVLHWYNPLVWWAACLARTDAELACDQATIKRIGENERAEYGRTLIGMTCQKRPDLFITATTMTGSKNNIKERIILLAKKPKMAIYTLVAVVLIALTVAGCTFTGAKEGQQDFAPDTVSMVQMLSSAFPPDPITDAKIVEDLWSLYQNFEFTGTTETLDKESVNAWGITVTFTESGSDVSESFTIFAGGLCSLGDDYTKYHILNDGASIYQVFLNYFQAAQRGELQSLSDVKISVDDLEAVPSDVVDYAKDYLAQQIRAYQTGWPKIAPGCSISEAKISGLTQMNTGTAGLDKAIKLYLLEYRLRVEGNVDAVLIGGMSAVEIDGENWLTEWNSVGQPYLLLACDERGAEPLWERICVTNSEELYQYNTPKMLEQYGDFYTAAARELYHKYQISAE